jgi:hypothetical protein
MAPYFGVGDVGDILVGENGGMRDGRPFRVPWWVVFAGLLAAALPASAGPPYVTDDPQPVEFRHWEFYAALTGESESGARAGDAPHVEVNYGPAPELQLHVIVPWAFARPSGGTTAWGLGDVELGAKFRFVEEGAGRPQVGTFPLVELPTGDASRGLGAPETRVFLPLWLQKTIGAWTTYGGGGYWINPGEGNRNWWFAGWQAQVQLTPSFAPGAEVYYESPSEAGARPRVLFNVGFVLDFGARHHLLGSAGAAFTGCDCRQFYVAYLLTLGPGS